MLTRPIPATAIPVVLHLRSHLNADDVRGLDWKPTDCNRAYRALDAGPVSDTITIAARVPDRARCPLGLLPGAIYDTPTLATELGQTDLTDAQVYAFWRWWDAQHDVKTALDALFSAPPPAEPVEPGSTPN